MNLSKPQTQEIYNRRKRTIVNLTVDERNSLKPHTRFEEINYEWGKQNRQDDDG